MKLLRIALTVFLFRWGFGFASRATEPEKFSANPVTTFDDRYFDSGLRK